MTSSFYVKKYSRIVDDLIRNTSLKTNHPSTLSSNKLYKNTSQKEFIMNKYYNPQKLIFSLNDNHCDFLRYQFNKEKKSSNSEKQMTRVTSAPLINKKYNITSKIKKYFTRNDKSLCSCINSNKNDSNFFSIKKYYKSKNDFLSSYSKKVKQRLELNNISNTNNKSNIASSIIKFQLDLTSI